MYEVLSSIENDSFLQYAFMCLLPFALVLIPLASFFVVMWVLDTFFWWIIHR